MSKPDDFQDFQSPHEASVDRLIQALDRAYHRPGLLMWRAFLQGVMTAVGAFVGAILIASIVGYIFHYYGGLSLLQPGLQKVQQMVPNSIQSNNQSNS